MNDHIDSRAGLHASKDVERNDDPLADDGHDQEQTLYRENILDHYKNPRNKRVIQDPSRTRAGKNPLCGDAIVVQVVVRDGVVHDVAFTGSGCAISQAAISMLTEELKGKSIQSVLCMGAKEVVDMLGIPISTVRMKCAMLGLRTVQEALDDKAADA